jgi:tetratricopeptide (TPR) repeat protein
MSYWKRRGTAALLAVGLALAVAAVARFYHRADWFDAYYGRILMATSALAFVAMSRLDRTFRWCRGKRFQRAYQDAISRGDLAGAKREIERVYGSGRLARDIGKLNEAVALSKAARFDESLHLVEAIPREGAESRLLPLLLNQIAWCDAHTGRAHEAVAIAREALDSAGKTAGRSFPQWMASFRGTLGASLALAGRSDEALPYLTHALKDHERPDSRAAVAYYMGVAYEGLGRRDEARANFERSVREAPDSLFGNRARSRLLEAYPSLK